MGRPRLHYVTAPNEGAQLVGLPPDRYTERMEFNELREKKMRKIRQFIAREFPDHAINTASRLNGEDILRITSPDGTSSYKILISEALLTEKTPSPPQLHHLLIHKDIASRIRREVAGLYILRQEDLF